MESRGLRNDTLMATVGKRERSKGRAFQTRETDGYESTIERAEKMYQTVKPTDDETFNKIVDFTQDLDYQFDDDKRNRQ